MSLFSRLFGNYPIDAKEADALLRMLGSVIVEQIEIEVREQARDVYTPRQLALPVMFVSGYLSCNLLRECPNALKSLPLLYLETKLYFDCLWQLYLLAKYPGAQHCRKISYLYSSVESILRALEDSALELEPDLVHVIGAPDSKSYKEKLGEVVPLYIQGRDSVDEDALTNAGIHASLRLTGIINSTRDTSLMRSVATDVANRTNEFLSIGSLTKFDLEKCEVLELPDWAYDQIGRVSGNSS